MELRIEQRIPPLDPFSLDVAELPEIEVYIDDKLVPNTLADIILTGLNFKAAILGLSIKELITRI